MITKFSILGLHWLVILYFSCTVILAETFDDYEDFEILARLRANSNGEDSSLPSGMPAGQVGEEAELGSGAVIQATQGPTEGQNGNQGASGPREQTLLQGLQGAKGEMGPDGLTRSDANMSALAAELQILKASVEFQDQKVPCGGYMWVDGSRDLIYEAPANGILHGCAWVVAARTVGPLKVRPVQDARLQWDSSFRLQVIVNIGDISKRASYITPTTPEITIPFQFIVVTFLGRTSLIGQGFRLRIQDDGGSEPSGTQVTFMREDGSFSMRYPSAPLSEYANNQALFVIGCPSSGRRVSVSLAEIDTEPTHDWVTFTTINPVSRAAVSAVRTGRGSSDIRGELKENMPFVLSFRSDDTVAGAGFSFNVSYTGPVRVSA